MTFPEYIDNPMGKNNAVFSNREIYRQMYMQKFDQIMVRENGKMDGTIYQGKDNDEYYAHMKVPSEVVPEFYYDVVVRFYKSKDNRKASITSPSLENYDIQVYSNDPSFVFTFAHAFIKNGMFFADLTDKMSKEAIKQNADERNPKNQIGYVKSLYFAYIMMRRRGLMSKIAYRSAPTYNKQALNMLVEHADDKVRKRQEWSPKEKKKKIKDEMDKQEEKKAKKLFENPDNLTTRAVKYIQETSTVKKTGKVGVTKPSSRVKPVSKVKKT